MSLILTIALMASIADNLDALAREVEHHSLAAAFGLRETARHIRSQR